MKKNLWLVVALAACVAATAARAQAVFPPKEAPVFSGPYVGAAIAAAQARRGCPAPLLGGGRVCDDRDPSWGFFGGYQLIRYFAAEVEYRDLGYLRATAPDSSRSTHTTVWDLTAIGIAPITERLSAFAKFGGYRALLQSDQSGIGDAHASGLTYAFGAQLDFGERFGLRALWQRYRNVKGGLNYGDNDYDTLGLALLVRVR